MLSSKNAIQIRYECIEQLVSGAIDFLLLPDRRSIVVLVVRFIGSDKPGAMPADRPCEDRKDEHRKVHEEMDAGLRSWL